MAIGMTVLEPDSNRCTPQRCRAAVNRGNHHGLSRMKILSNPVLVPRSAWLVLVPFVECRYMQLGKQCLNKKKENILVLIRQWNAIGIDPQQTTLESELGSDFEHSFLHGFDH